MIEFIVSLNDFRLVSSIVYAVDTAGDRDGLLAYLPGRGGGGGGGAGEAEERNFLALEMVERRVRFVWNCGAGSGAIVSNVTIETANNLKADDHMWYKITAERLVVNHPYPLR